MKKFIIKLKKIFIVYVVSYLIFGNVTSCFAQSYSSSAGEYLSEFTVDFINTYGGTNSVYGGRTGRDTGSLTTSATQYPGWTDGTLDSPGGKLYCCCTSGVWYMYYLALGIDIYNYSFDAKASTNLTSLSNSEYWEEVSLSDTLPGDIIISTSTSHAELVLSAGNAKQGNFGNPSSSGAAIIHATGSTTWRAFRLSSSVDVNPSGTVSGTISSSSYTFSDFYFNGIPDGTYSLASSNFWEALVETLASIADYLIGILTYIIRAVIVGWTSIIDRLFNWTINTVTDTNTEAEDIEDMGISGADVDETDSSDRITLESIFYGTYDLLNINIFD